MIFVRPPLVSPPASGGRTDDDLPVQAVSDWAWRGGRGGDRARVTLVACPDGYVVPRVPMAGAARARRYFGCR